MVTALPNLVMYGWVDSYAGVSGNNGIVGYSNTFAADGIAETLEHFPYCSWRSGVSWSTQPTIGRSGCFPFGTGPLVYIL